VIRLATTAAIAWFAIGCAHAPPAASGRLRIKCCATVEGWCPEPDTLSRIFVDEAYAGDCGDWPEAGRDVRAGRHRVEIARALRGWARDGHDVIVPEGGEVTVQMYYERTPD